MTSRVLVLSVFVQVVVYMPGPQNANKKKRAQQKKHHARVHSSIAAQKAARPASPDLSPPTPVTFLSSPTIATQEANEAEPPCPDPHVKFSVLENTSLPSHGTPYGPPDDPTLILLSNPIIVNHGNGPRVQDMRAFLNSSFAQPAWTADELCAEFAQHEILQMLRTVLPEETSLVRLFVRSHSACQANNRPRSACTLVPVVQQEQTFRARLSRLSPPLHAG